MDFTWEKQPRSFRVLVIFPNKKTPIVLQNKWICVQKKYPGTIKKNTPDIMSYIFYRQVTCLYKATRFPC